MARSELIQSLTRGLEVVRFAADSEHGVMLAEIADHLQVKAPTAHNLARTLVANGFLEKTTRPVRYRLGPGVFELVEAHAKRDWLQKAAGVVRDTFKALPESTVILVEPIGMQLSVCLRMDAKRPTILERYPGRTLSLYANAVGLCLLAFSSGPEAQIWYENYPFTEYGGHVWADAEALESYLSETRKAGLVKIANDRTFRVAAPIYGRGGQLVAGLGICIPDEAPPEDVKQFVISSVQDGARELSA